MNPNPRPMFTLVTPSLQRQSLIRCCDSVDIQSYTSWQHVIVLDVETRDEELLEKIAHPQRLIIQCGTPHRDFGNTCRRNAWHAAEGDNLAWVDDDNEMAHPDALRDMEKVLRGSTFEFSLFPIMRHGAWFFNDPPGLCMTDSANLVVRRDVGQWPDMRDYCADGHFAEALKVKYPNYGSFPNVAPIISVPVSSQGR